MAGLGASICHTILYNDLVNQALGQNLTLKKLVHIFCLLGWAASYGQPSVLSTGKWYKVSVEQDGVYKIDYPLLRKLGINPDQIDPATIQLYGGMNGMLPQVNNNPRINDLKEIAVSIVGAEDGKFNKGDYVLFFGQGPDLYQLVPGVPSGTTYQNNIYTDKNYYFLTVGSSIGKRATITNSQGDFPSVAEFDDFAYYETDQFNELHSGRHWYGEQFDSKTEYTIRFTMPGIIPGSTLYLKYGVMAQSFSESSFQYYHNGVKIAEHAVPAILDAQYTPKGSDVSGVQGFSADAGNATFQANQDVRVKFIKPASGRPIGYLDYLLLTSKRKLAWYGAQMIFHSQSSLQQPVTKFLIESWPSEGFAWDVTDPFQPAIMDVSSANGIGIFSNASDVLRKYAVFSKQDLPLPSAEGEVQNQNLHAVSSVDLLIVTAPEFVSEAQRLAGYRQSANGLKTLVVTTTQVYNEFSGGKQDVSAIRDFAKYLNDKNTGLKYLLLFGRGSYDYKNYLPYNKNFVPTYESRNSLSPLETYSSDDYFGFLESNEGNWGEDPAEPHTLDISVGRLPVKKIEEARIVVDKLIEYDLNSPGDWRKQLVFVSDDGDFNIHHAQSDLMAESIETNHPEFNVKKIYLDAFVQKMSQIGQVSPDATTALSNAARQGAVIVNYTGHGGEQQWMQERILDQVSLGRWKTAPRYPLLITATCEFGRNDDPGLISTAELSMIMKGGGSIGLVTSARPVNSSTNFTLNLAFYQALFIKDQNQFRTLGAVMRDTKNNSISGIGNRNFSLLGDPSMKLALPNSEIRVSQLVNLNTGSDTLKGGSRVRLSGQIYSNGLPDTGYQGTLAVTLFNKAVPEKTKGDENAQFSFMRHDSKAFSGQASINNGFFQLEFTLTSAIDPVVGPGKLSLYAYSKAKGKDVAGVQVPVKIGSSVPLAPMTGPQVELFMGDTTFIDGGVVGTNSRIVAILSDDYGINISDFIQAQPRNIVAVLDDTLTFQLNNYYTADIDNPRRGKVNYPIDNLKPGIHHLEMFAYNTGGKVGSAMISFSVSDQPGIQIEQWLAYPNPVSTTATFHFRHNRSGEDLEAVVTIFDRVGHEVLTTTYQVNGSPYQVDLPPWDTMTPDGTKIAGGLYLLKLTVRSLLDGSKNEKITKVIISN
jgi:hypothetical protein